MGKALFVSALALVAGCATGVVDEPAPPPERAPDAPAIVPNEGPSVETPTANGAPPGYRVGDTVRAATPLRFTCRKDAFCDDFEDTTPGSRWTSIVPSDATLSFVGPSSSLGARAIRVAASANGAPSYLELAGRSLEGSWAGALGVSLRLDALPQTGFAGPELVVRDTNGVTVAQIAIVVVAGAIGIEQRAADADGAGASSATRIDLLAPASASTWHRVLVGIEAQDIDEGPFGRIEVSIDGSDNAILPLVVKPIGGPVALRAGVTRADSAATVARVDDVMFFVR